MNINEKARLERNAYMKAWRDKNPERVKAAINRYWVKRALELIQNESKVTK